MIDPVGSDGAKASDGVKGFVAPPAADRRGRTWRLSLSQAARSVPVVICFCLLAGLVLLGTVAPALFSSGAIEAEIAQQLRLTTGLQLSTRDPARFELLPRPHVSLRRFTIFDPNGTLGVEAQALDGDVRLLPLIAGRIELTAVALDHPRVTVNLDGRAMPPASVIGRVLRDPLAGEAIGPVRLGTVSFIDGTVRFLGQGEHRLPELHGLDLTLDWRDLNAPATLTGSMLIRKGDAAAEGAANEGIADVAADVAAWIAAPASLMRKEHSAIAFRVHAEPMDVAASGDLSGAGFRGHVSASAPSVSKLVELLGATDSVLAPFDNTKLDSDVTAAVNARHELTVDLPNLSLRTDGNIYEGTLAFLGGPVSTVSGTLASDQINAAPFASWLPPLLDSDRNWSTTSLLRTRPPRVNLDLRVSAGHLRLAPFTLDDAAIAIITRGDRVELALADAKAYGGSAKGRLSVGASGPGLDVRGTGALTGVDAATLSWDAFGRQVAAGTMTIALNLETYGGSADALMAHLGGGLRLDGADGELTDIDMGRALREAVRQRPEGIAAALRTGRTPYKALALRATLRDGTAIIEDSTIKGADAALALGGTADLRNRRLDLHALASPPLDLALPPGLPADLPLPRLDIAVTGPMAHAVVTPKLRGVPAP